QTVEHRVAESRQKDVSNEVSTQAASTAVSQENGALGRAGCRASEIDDRFHGLSHIVSFIPPAQAADTCNKQRRLLPMTPSVLPRDSQACTESRMRGNLWAFAIPARPSR